MNNIYANPVGIVKKEIYIIKNDINDKVYIGQSVNSNNRFKSHCKKNKYNSLIGRAIQKYGKEHFWIEILEEKTESYNDREKYWISKFKSVNPNGYNITLGGEDPPRYKGETHPSAQLSDKEVELIKQDLRYTTLSLNTIANKFKTSKKQVLRINQGISRSQINETYPIRKIPNKQTKLSDEEIEMIIDTLKYTYRLNGTIAREYGVEVHLISDINQGLSYKKTDENYPIRKWKSCGKAKFTYEEVTFIIALLKNTNTSIRKIAKMYNVEHNLISAICYGTAKKYRRDYENYPLRKPS